MRQGGERGDGATPAHASVLEEWWRRTFEEWLSIADYWRERQRILKDPEIVFRRGPDGPERGPLHFALQPVLIFLFLFTVISTSLPTILPALRPHFSVQTLPDIEEKIAVARYLQEHAPTDVERIAQTQELTRLRHDRRRERMAEAQFDFFLNGFKVLVGIHFLILSALFRRRLLPYQDEHPRVQDADRAFLYYGRAAAPWTTLIGLTLLFILETLNRYGITSAVERQIEQSSGEKSAVMLFSGLALAVFVGAVVTTRITRHKESAGLQTLARLFGFTDAQPVRRALSIARFQSIFLLILIEIPVLIYYMLPAVLDR